MYILFDIGGTKMRIASSDDGKQLSESQVFDTPKKYEEGVGLFRQKISELVQDGKIEAIAGGIAGPYSPKEQKLVNAPNLPDWIGRPLKEDLGKQFNCAVFIENDAALTALGEATQGAGKGFGIVAFLTVSTGVGGARVVDGRIDCRAVGFEPGHQIIDFENGGSETLQHFISGAGIKERTGREAREITDEKFWNDLARTLAAGINNIIVLWSPDVIVLGGPMILGSPAIDLDKVHKHLGDMLKIFPAPPPIKKAELGDRGGLLGALEYLRQQKA